MSKTHHNQLLLALIVNCQHKSDQYPFSHQKIDVFVCFFLTDLATVYPLQVFDEVINHTNRLKSGEIHVKWRLFEDWRGFIQATPLVDDARVLNTRLALRMGPVTVFPYVKGYKKRVLLGSSQVALLLDLSFALTTWVNHPPLLCLLLTLPSIASPLPSPQVLWLRLVHWSVELQEEVEKSKMCDCRQSGGGRGRSTTIPLLALLVLLLSSSYTQAFTSPTSPLALSKWPAVVVIFCLHTHNWGWGGRYCLGGSIHINFVPVHYSYPPLISPLSSCL